MPEPARNVMATPRKAMSGERPATARSMRAHLRRNCTAKTRHWKRGKFE